jgi:hypothetical protein
MYLRIAYLSNRVAGLTDEHLLDGLVLPARVRNLEVGVTSCLWSDGEHFFQLLEGQEAVVLATLERIVEDRRHTHVRIILSEKAQGLVFQHEPLKLVLASPLPGQTDAVERTMRDLIELVERPEAAERNRLTRQNVTAEAARFAAASGDRRDGRGIATQVEGPEQKRAPLVVNVLTRLTCAQGV